MMICQYARQYMYMSSLFHVQQPLETASLTPRKPRIECVDLHGFETVVSIHLGSNLVPCGPRECLSLR